MSVLEQIKEAVTAGQHERVAELTRKALDEGMEVDQIVNHGFIPAMTVVGERFGSGQIYIPEMLIAARAMKTGMGILQPLLVGQKTETIATAVLGTVEGDMHDIGKNLVGMMMEGSGVEVIDLGVDVSQQKFVEAVKQHNPDFVAMSALLTTTMVNMQRTIEALEEAGVRGNVKVLVGGAPVNQKYAEQIGADGYGDNASQAVARMKKLLG